MKYLIYIFSFLVLFLGCSEDRIGDSSSGTIEGTVVASETNEKLENVKISTQPSTSTVFTDSNGKFTIENVADENYSVQADLDEYISQFEVANVSNGITIEIVFELLLEEEANSAPSLPELISPENNAIDIPTEVELIWSSMDPDDNDEVNYTVSLYNDTNDDIATFENVTDTTLTIQNLLNSTRYFWQVAADDGVNDAVQSGLFNFNTVTASQTDILFVRKINGNNVIYSGTDEDDSVTFAITALTENCWRPRRNVTTGKIAFLKSVGGATHLFTMDSDGSNQFQVTQNVPVNGFNFDEIDFAWKPEGDKLLFPSFANLYSINTDGSGQSVFYTTTNGNFITEIDWSDFNNIIAVKTNDSDGYNAEIFTIDATGTLLVTVFSGMQGGAGGLDLNIDGTLLLYSYDISESELPSYLPQDMRLFLYDLQTDVLEGPLNTGVSNGFNDLDPSFSPNENSVILTRKGVSQGATPKVILHQLLVNTQNFEILFENASMPDWEN